MSTSSAPALEAHLYAGFWRRVAAYYLDGIVVLVVAAPLLIPFMSSETLMMIGSVAIVVLYLGYFPVMHATRLQATIGKWLLGVKVTDRQGNRIGIGRSLGRFLAMFLISSSLTLGIGYLTAGVTQRRQALHDMVAGTLVVRRGATPDEVTAGGRTMPLTLGVWAIIIGLPVLGLIFGVASEMMFAD